MIRQFVPQEVCLKCQGCCRFKEEDSVWLPCFLEEEIQGLLDKKIPPAVISMDRKIRPIPNLGQEGFICAFFDPDLNKCSIYDFRPFECQMYPFLICVRDKKILLTVDMNCPYINERLDTKEFKDYCEYLSAYLNTPKQIKMLKENPQIIQAYQDVLDLMELEVPDETK